VGRGVAAAGYSCEGVEGADSGGGWVVVGYTWGFMKEGL
jgi:hypothetical protein